MPYNEPLLMKWDEEGRKQAAPSIMEKGSVLIIDDDEADLSIESKVLRDAGYLVGRARSSGEAVEVFKRAMRSARPFGLVALTLNVAADMGGIDAFKEMVKLDPGIKAVIADGPHCHTVVENHTGYGLRYTLFRPGNASALIDVVAELTKRSVRPGDKVKGGCDEKRGTSYKRRPQERR